MKQIHSYYVSNGMVNVKLEENNRSLSITHSTDFDKHFPGIDLKSQVRCRNSRSELFCKKGVLRNFTKFTGKHLCQSLFFNKVAGQISKNTFLHRTPLMASSVLLSRLNIPALFLFFQGDRVNVVGLYGI